MTITKVGIIGSSGRLGYYIKGFLAAKNIVYLSFKRHSDSLFIYKKDLEDFLVKNNFSHIINLSACTNLELCERNPEIAIEVNENLVKTITDILSGNNLLSKLIQVSTDQVYGDSFSIQGSDENQSCNPLNTYAKTKYNAEQYIREATLNDYIIARLNFTGMSFSYSNPSFSDWLFKSLVNQEDIKIYTNIFFNPIHALDATRIILKLIMDDFSGVINIGSSEAISKSQFCRMMAKKLSLPTSLMQDCEYSLLDSCVNRPKNMVTNISKLKSLIDPQLLSTERLMHLLYYQYSSLLGNDLH